jgi:hypothetical protein
LIIREVQYKSAAIHAGLAWMIEAELRETSQFRREATVKWTTSHWLSQRCPFAAHQAADWQKRRHNAAD